MRKDVAILPMDGQPSETELITKLTGYMQGQIMPQLVAYAKFNDALHFPRVGPEILAMVAEVVPASVRSMIDLKIADVSETNRNTLRHYRPYNPGIVTVTSTVGAKSLMAVKEALPDTTIAIVDTLTDISDEEIMDRYGMVAAEKIRRSLIHFEKYLRDDNPIKLVVCSPKELGRLKDEFGDRYEYLTPGIRSPHMAADHQKRTTSLYDALTAGARFAVMGAQLTKGNPERGILPEESQAITLGEVDHYLREQNFLAEKACGTTA